MFFADKTPRCQRPRKFRILWLSLDIGKQAFLKNLEEQMTIVTSMTQATETQVRNHLLIISLLHHMQSDIIQALSSFWTALLLLLFEPLPHPLSYEETKHNFKQPIQCHMHQIVVQLSPPQKISTQMGFRACLPFIHC